MGQREAHFHIRTHVHNTLPGSTGSVATGARHRRRGEAPTVPPGVGPTGPGPNPPPALSPPATEPTSPAQRGGSDQAYFGGYHLGGMVHGSSQLGLLSGRKHTGSSSGGNQKPAKRVSTAVAPGPQPHPQLPALGAGPDALQLTMRLLTAPAAQLGTGAGQDMGQGAGQGTAGGGPVWGQAGGVPFAPPGPQPHPQLPAGGFAGHSGGGMRQDMGTMEAQQAATQQPGYKPTFVNKCLRWTPRLHSRFVWAVDRLGGPYNALPKAIYNSMKVGGIALVQVDHYLQRYRQKARAADTGA